MAWIFRFVRSPSRGASAYAFEGDGSRPLYALGGTGRFVDRQFRSLEGASLQTNMTTLQYEMQDDHGSFVNLPLMTSSTDAMG